MAKYLGADGLERLVELIKEDRKLGDGEVLSRNLGDSSVTTGKMSDMSVTRQKLSLPLQLELGVADQSAWTFAEFLAAAQQCETTAQQEAVVAGIESGKVNSWTPQQAIQLAACLDASPQNSLLGKLDAASVNSWPAGLFGSMPASLEVESQRTVLGKLDFGQRTWGDIDEIVNSVTPAALSAVVGKTKADSFGEWGDVTFRVIGANHDDLAAGGKARTTWQSTGPVTQRTWSTGNHAWKDSQLRSYLNSTGVGCLPASLASAVKQVSKLSNVTASSTVVSTQEKVFVPSLLEVVGSYSTSMVDGSLYDYFSGMTDSQVIEAYGWNPGTSSSYYSFTRTTTSVSSGFRVGAVRGIAGRLSSTVTTSTSAYVHPCFCV